MRLLRRWEQLLEKLEDLEQMQLWLEQLLNLVVEELAEQLKVQLGEEVPPQTFPYLSLH